MFWSTIKLSKKEKQTKSQKQQQQQNRENLFPSLREKYFLIVLNLHGKCFALGIPRVGWLNLGGKRTQKKKCKEKWKKLKLCKRNKIQRKRFKSLAEIMNIIMWRRQLTFQQRRFFVFLFFFALFSFFCSSYFIHTQIILCVTFVLCGKYFVPYNRYLGSVMLVVCWFRRRYWETGIWKSLFNSKNLHFHIFLNIRIKTPGNARS